MEINEIIERLNKESSEKVPDVYDRVVSRAKAEGLFDLEEVEGTEVYDNGGTVVAGLGRRRKIAVAACCAVAAVSLAIALPVVISKSGGGDLPPATLSQDTCRDYGMGAVSTVKLIDAFDSSSSLRARTAAVKRDGANQFTKYFDAFGTFFGEDAVTTEAAPLTGEKYANKLTINGRYANGDPIAYSLYYTEARVDGESSADGNTVKYYLDGGFTLEGGVTASSRTFLMLGERVYDSAAKADKSLTIRAFPDSGNRTTYAQMETEYPDGNGTVRYNYKVVIGGQTVSEATAYKPAPEESGASAAYVFEIKGVNDGEDGVFTVNNPADNGFITVDFAIGEKSGQYVVSRTESAYDFVLAGQFVYRLNGDGTCAVAGYDKNTQLPEELIIPNAYKGNAVTAIDPSAFAYSKIKSVTIPEGVTLIDGSAFTSCVELVTATLPDGLKAIKSGAFNYCPSLENINLPDSVEEIGNLAFKNCNFTDVVLPKNLKYLDWSFSECPRLKSLHISAGVTRINGAAVSQCPALDTLSVDGGNTTFYSAGNCVIEKATHELVMGCVASKIPQDGSVLTIGYNAFYYRTTLKSIELPQDITVINENAFMGCGLESLELPSGLKTVKKNAFNECYSLKTVAFPSTLWEIEYGAFGKCQNLESVYFHENVKYVQEGAFYNCRSLETIGADENNKYYYADGNCLIERDTGNLVLGCKNSVIPDNGDVTHIGFYAFYGSGVEQLVVPEGVSMIGYAAFQSSSIRNIVLPQSLTVIGEDAFMESSLEVIDIPDSVEKIGVYAFARCFGLYNVKLPSGLETIESGVFSECVAISSIVLPETLTYIGGNAFYGCSSLREIEIPFNVKEVGAWAFERCTSLKKVDMFCQITEINANTFKGCYELESVTLGRGVTFIDDQAFYGCNSLFLINFQGSQSQWEQIGKGAGWDYGTSEYLKIYCDDGVLDA